MAVQRRTKIFIAWNSPCLVRRQDLLYWKAFNATLSLVERKFLRCRSATESGTARLCVALDQSVLFALCFAWHRRQGLKLETLEQASRPPFRTASSMSTTCLEGEEELSSRADPSTAQTAFHSPDVGVDIADGPKSNGRVQVCHDTSGHERIRGKFLLQNAQGKVRSAMNAEPHSEGVRLVRRVNFVLETTAWSPPWHSTHTCVRMIARTRN